MATTQGGVVVTAWDVGTETPDSLRPFTSTAQVPIVSGPQYVDPHAEWGIPRRWRPAPLGLRLAVVFTALLVLAGLAGIAVHKARPSALAWLEPGRTHPAASQTSRQAPPSTAAPAKAKAKAPSASQPVTQTTTGPQASTVQVDTTQYTVVVLAQNRCWVSASDPTSTTPQFASVLSAGAQQTFHPTNGQLDVNLGASAVTVSVMLAGKSAAAWQFTPPAAPYTLTFTSSAR